MKIKSKRVNLSIIPSRIKKIIDFGRANLLHAADGSLQLTTICTKIIYFILDLFGKREVQLYLEKHGGTLFDLIIRAVQQYISDDNKER